MIWLLTFSINCSTLSFVDQHSSAPHKRISLRWNVLHRFYQLTTPVRYSVYPITKHHPSHPPTTSIYLNSACVVGKPACQHFKSNRHNDRVARSPLYRAQHIYICGICQCVCLSEFVCEYIALIWISGSRWQLQQHTQPHHHSLLLYRILSIVARKLSYGSSTSSSNITPASHHTTKRSAQLAFRVWLYYTHIWMAPYTWH